MRRRSGTSVLNEGQRQAVEAALKAFENDRWFKLDGAAGTGKTYTVPHILNQLPGVEAIGSSVSHIATKRLANSLELKNCPIPCKTVAALFYRHEKIETPEYDKALADLERRVERGELTPNTKAWLHAKLVDVDRYLKDIFVLDTQGQVTKLGDDDVLVIDEYSMVKPEIYTYIVEHTKCRILLLGDSFQLPPVGHHHNAFETIPVGYELTRIERGNGTNIPEIGGLFRQDRARFDDGDYGQFTVRTSPSFRRQQPFANISIDEWGRWGRMADIIIAPYHRLRRLATTAIRRALFHCGIDRPLMRGDRFLVRRRNKYGFENAMMLTLGKELAFPPKDVDFAPEGYLRLDLVDHELLRRIWLKRAYEDGAPTREMPRVFDPEPLYFPISMLQWAYHDGDEGDYRRAIEKAKGEVEYFQETYDRDALVTVLEYAWAVTVHAVQGAEFDRVIFLYSGWNGDALEARRLVYTGITRARKQVLMLRSNQWLFA